MSLDNRRPAAGPSKDEIRMNMAALQRIDPFIVQIIHSSSQVALYKFLQSEWDKTEVEGTLFVYARKCAPKYGFLILNRKSADNWIQPITGGLDTQLQAPFLLYKSKDEVYGIWFYEQPDCFLIYETINKLVREFEDASLNMNSNGGAGNDLASLLMKAQGQTPDTEKRKQKLHTAKPSPSGGEKLLRLLSRDADGQNGASGSTAPSGSSVEAFFAQVSRQEHEQNGGGFLMGDNGNHPPSGHPSRIPGFLIGMPHQVEGIFPFGGNHQQQQQQPQLQQPSPLLHLQNQMSNNVDDGTRHAMLQTLLSNPGVVSVETLERAHREESESPVATNGGASELPPMPLTATKADDLEAAFKNKVKINQSPGGTGRGGGSAGKRGRNAASSGGHQQQQQQRPGKSPQQQRQGHQPVARQAQPFSYASAVAYGEPGKSPRGPAKATAAPEGNVSTAATVSNPSPLKQAPAPVPAKRSFEVEQEPVQLLSPMVFAAPEPAVSQVMAGPAMSAAAFIPNPLQLNGAYESDKLEPLTKGQFLQAFLHLLRTDDHFVGQLHQAYVEALNTKLH